MSTPTTTPTGTPHPAADTATGTATDTRQVRYPSTELPAVPPFEIDVPAGFVAHSSPRAVAVVRPAAAGTGFTANVTVTADLVPHGADPTALLDAMLAQQGGGVDTTQPVASGERETSRTLTRTVDGVPVRQVATVHVLPTRYAGGVTHALTVVSSWASEQDAEHADVLRAIHTSFQVTNG